MSTQQIENVFTMNTNLWIAVMKDGRQIDIFDKELDLLTHPADVAFVARYRNWATNNTAAVAVPVAGTAPQRAPTPVPFLRRLFSVFF
jgi:hypothetical protein